MLVHNLEFLVGKAILGVRSVEVWRLNDGWIRIDGIYVRIDFFPHVFHIVERSDSGVALHGALRGDLVK